MTEKDNSQERGQELLKKTQRQSAAKAPEQKIEIGGRKGPEPTRYGDWELNGKCVDF